MVLHDCRDLAIARLTISFAQMMDRVGELETITGFVETYDPGTNRYRLVLMCQTVDHLLDRMEALGEAQETADLIAYYCDEMEANDGYVRPMAVATSERKSTE